MKAARARGRVGNVGPGVSQATRDQHAGSGLFIEFDAITHKVQIALLEEEILVGAAFS